MSNIKQSAFTKLHNPEHCQSMDEVYVMSRFVNAQHRYSKGVIHSFIHELISRHERLMCVWPQLHFRKPKPGKCAMYCMKMIALSTPF